MSVKVIQIKSDEQVHAEKTKDDTIANLILQLADSQQKIKDLETKVGATNEWLF